MTSKARRRAAVGTSEAVLRTRRVRIVLGITILIFSIALLIWGLMPPRREVRTQPISPTELQLPTPTSFLISSLRVA